MIVQGLPEHEPASAAEPTRSALDLGDQPEMPWGLSGCHLPGLTKAPRLLAERLTYMPKRTRFVEIYVVPDISTTLSSIS